TCRHHVRIRHEVRHELLIDVVDLAARALRDDARVRARCHLADREVNTALQYRIERYSVVAETRAVSRGHEQVDDGWLLGLRIFYLGALGERGAVFGPHGVRVRESRRSMSHADDDRQVSLFDAVARTGGGEVIVCEENLLAET